ncbi:MAG: hypothetical protein EOL88_09035, partial [Bacteroidia bacterium]|nr:hypothetical protein [Bacteroidia bacterium]
MGKDQWQGAIEALLQEDAPAEIALESEYDETHGTTSITYNLRVFNPEDDDYYFSLVLIEDDIVSPQKNSNPN